MKGLGADLLQNGQPVAFESKALTAAETRYADIEWEMLAVVFGCEKFHNYLLGQVFTVESNHKSLSAIYLKHLTAASPHLQWLLLRLQPYDMCASSTLERKDVAIADALSRLSGEDEKPLAMLILSVMKRAANLVHRCWNIFEQQQATIQKWLPWKKLFVGWPPSRSDVHRSLHPCWNFQDEI